MQPLTTFEFDQPLVGEQQILLDMATAEADALRQRIARLECRLAISEELAAKRGTA